MIIDCITETYSQVNIEGWTPHKVLLSTTEKFRNGSKKILQWIR